MKRIAFIALERALASSITIPLEMLYAACTLARVSRQDMATPIIDIVGLDPAPVTMAGGLQVTPTTAIRSAPRFDLVFVPGLWGSPLKSLRKAGLLTDWLVSAHRQGAVLCSLVTGSYFLAEAGLLNGRSATTHWFYFDDFEGRYPEVNLDRKRFITLDDDLYCTGSVNAARDVTLHLVAQLFNDHVAGEIAKQFTHEIKRSYESMLLGLQRQDTHHDEQIIAVQEWLQAHYQEAISLEQVAGRFRMSVRSLNRRFRNATQVTPLQYLQETRIQQAKLLLKRSNLAIAEVSYAVGYQDASHFSNLFKRSAGITPAEYRDLVRSKLFRVE